MSLCKNMSQKCVRFAALIFLVAASALAAQAQVVFSPPKNISNSSGNTQGQQIAVEAHGNVNVVWLDNSLGNYAVFFSRSIDGGATFSTPVSISKHAQSTASLAQIALDSSGNIDVAWTETSPDGSAHFIYFSRSTNGGASFTNPQNISGDAGAASGQHMAVDSSGNINVVWADTSLGNSQIFFSRSGDGGVTFSTPLNISNDTGNAIEPRVAVDSGGNIDVAWEDNTPTGIAGVYDAFFSRSNDGGATFSSTLQLTKSSQFHHVEGLGSIAVGGNGNIYLSWQQGPSEGGTGLVVSRSTDAGTSFSQTVSFNTFSPGVMAIDPSGNDVGIGYHFDIDTPTPSAEFAFSTDGVSSFVGGVSGPYFSFAPQIAVDTIGRFDTTYSFAGSPLYDQRNEPTCLCFAQNTDGNQPTGAVIITSYAPSQPAALALDSGGNVYVTWEQSATSGGPANVYFSKGTVPPFSFSFSPPEVSEGASSTGTVKLVSPAPAGGVTISLSSSNPSVVSVPATVAVPQGASKATFTLSASAVQSFTFTTVSASLNGSTNTASLSVDPLFELFVFGNTTGGNTAGGEASLPENAPSGGLTIALSSSDPSVASVPASVTVPAGSRFASFNIPTSSMTAPTTVQITGTSNGFTHSTSFRVQPARLQQVSVSPTTATNGASSTGTVTLNGPAPAGGAVVSLSSSDPSATVPSSVTIPAGSTSASFTITTNTGSSTTAINVTISASYSGTALTTSLTVQPLFLQGLLLTASTIGGGGTVSNCQAQLNVRAPDGGVVVSLSSSNPSVARVPASVTAQAQGFYALFDITTSPVSTDTPVTISATFNGVTRTATLTVQPITLEAVYAGPVTGGNPDTGTVILNGPAPAGGAVISLSSSDPSVASVPTSVTIPAGVTGMNFSGITTSPVSAQTTVTITASWNGVTVTHQFPVFPPQ